VGAAVQVTRTDHSSAELRAVAAKTSDGGQVRRLLAIAMILDGHSRERAAAQSGMDRQTLRDWVHRYNEAGIAGLASIRTGGRTALLTADQMAELKQLVIDGPDPETDKVVRWRCVDLREVVAKRFAVTVTERTIGKWLRKMDLTRLQPRPFHPKQDEAAFSSRGATSETFQRYTTSHTVISPPAGNRSEHLLKPWRPQPPQQGPATLQPMTAKRRTRECVGSFSPRSRPWRWHSATWSLRALRQ